MTTEQYSIGYDAGYQDGFDAALADPVKQESVKNECKQCGGDCPRFECDTHNTWMNERVKQEPVAWFHKIGCRANAFGECDMGCQPPVDAKAIREAARAEALEEAAKWCEDEYQKSMNPWLIDYAAAIRGLK